MDSSGALDLDASPPEDQSQLPQQRSQQRGLFFRTPTPREVEDDPGTLSEGTPEVLAGDGSDSEPGWTSGESDPWSDADPDSSTASSTGERPAQLLSKRQLKETAEAAVHIGTGMVHTVAAKTQLQQQMELYKADADDAKAIGHPIAEIAYRRGDVVGGKLSSDANNLLQSALGIAGYFAKQINKIGTIRQIEAAQAAGEVQTFPTAEGAA